MEQEDTSLEKFVLDTLEKLRNGHICNKTAASELLAFLCKKNEIESLKRENKRMQDLLGSIDSMLKMYGFRNEAKSTALRSKWD